MPKVSIRKGQDTQVFMLAVTTMLLLTFPFMYWQQVFAATGAVTITTTVATSLTFTTTTSSSDVFGTINAGSVKFATTTLDVSTNDVLGWTVSLSGDNKSTGNNNLQTAGNQYSITDQTEWVPGAATTSVGNAVRISSLINSQNVLAFRVMTASSTNGAVFYAPTWWGTADSYTDNANTLWAGISSSTVQRNIGSAGVGSYSANRHVNTVNYYLSVAATQATGSYSAPLTFTAVAS